MAYRYDYGALMSANKTNNNFKPLSEVQGTPDHTNYATALLESKGLTVGTTDTDNVLSNLPALQNDSQVELAQNIANLSESDTAVARGDKWGGSDDTMGKSWLEKIVAGDVDTSNISVEDLYTQGFGRASDQEGSDYWTSSGQSIQDIAKSFVGSEEATYRTGYHENYGRDADQAGLDYWMTSGGTEHHGASDTSADFNRVLTATGANEQKETSVRNLLSSELGLHSTDDQRAADTSLAGVFTDASEEDVFRMMQSGDFGAAELAEIVRMQKAAAHMGDFGGGPEDAGATNIHRILSKLELDNPALKNLTADDYKPKITKTLDAEGNLVSREESNVWSLLKPNTQTGIVTVNKPEVETKPIVETPDDTITATNVDVDYMPELHSDVEDTSTYGQSKDAFDSDAAGIDAPLQDMMIRNTGAMTVGGSAEGVRLKRSKKFKSGESALGTKQLGRELQIKSLNI